MASLVHNQQPLQPHQLFGEAQFGHQALKIIQDQPFGLEQGFDKFRHDFDMERLAPNHETMGDTHSSSTLLMDRNPIHLTQEDVDFEIKPRVISLVKQAQYYGLPQENPLDHIDSFEDLCGAINTNGAPFDHLRCRLFSFSLAGDAFRWMKSLAPQSITSWRDYKQAFLEKFFTKKKLSALRNKISGFQQGPIEPYHECLERYKEYIRDCPQHGFAEAKLWNIFYQGVNREHKRFLDICSRGNFMQQSVSEAKILIDNLAASDSMIQPSYDETVKAINIEPTELTEIKVMVSQILKNTMQFKAHEVVTAPHEDLSQDCIGDFSACDLKEVNYIGTRYQNLGTRYHDPHFGPKGRFYAHQNVPQENYTQSKQQFVSGVQRTHATGFQGAKSKEISEEDFEPLINGFHHEFEEFRREIHTKMDILGQDIYNKIEEISSHVKQIDLQIAYIAGTVGKPDGFLPGKVEVNPRGEHVKAITLRSGTQLDEVLMPKETEEDIVIEVLEEDKIPDTENVHETPGEVEIPPEVTRVYKPKIPFPSALKKPKKEKEQAKLKELVSQLTVRLPFVDACMIIPALRKYMKSILTSNISLEEGVMLITQECSTRLQDKEFQKLEDPGSFVLPCEIGGSTFQRCLCDLGSSVNLMPYTVAKRLGITNFKPTKIQLVFADRSVKRPVGIIADLQVIIGDCCIPADFVVLELDQEPRDPIILGRPFLATAGAMIDVKGGKIKLNLGDLILNFEVDEALQRPTIDGSAFWVDQLSEASVELCEELIVNDPLEIALTKIEGEDGYLEGETNEYAKILDSASTYDKLVTHFESDEDITEATPPRTLPKELQDPWSELKAPKVELKELPVGLRYAYLGDNQTYPVIVNSNLSNVESDLLLCELRKYRKALGYSLGDITGISPDLCMHRIILEDKFASSIEHQRRLNPNLKDVVKKEIIKLVEAGIIYAISDSTWVSPVHVVPKKGGVTVVKNENDELIPTRTITGHRMCIDYRKLNTATRKIISPFPL